MTTPSETPVTTNPVIEGLPSRQRVRIGVGLTVTGFLVFLLGIHPDLLRTDGSPVFGFVQIEVFLIGLAIICMGGYASLMDFWRNGSRSIPADIGIRLILTGYIIALFSGMADVFGFGTQLQPRIPLFGPWQASGVIAGEALIAIGFLLMFPLRLPHKR